MKPIPFPSFLIHKRDKPIGANPITGKARGASNWPIYGIVCDDNTKPWTMEQEKMEYYWHTFWFLAIPTCFFLTHWAYAVALIVAVYNPASLALLELRSHSRDIRAWVHIAGPSEVSMRLKAAIKSESMREHYPYVRWCMSSMYIYNHLLKAMGLRPHNDSKEVPQ